MPFKNQSHFIHAKLDGRGPQCSFWRRVRFAEGSPIYPDATAENLWIVGHSHDDGSV